MRMVWLNLSNVGSLSMGQAKARGTFEERKAKAVEKKAKLNAAKVEIEIHKPSPILSKNTLILQAILRGMGQPYYTRLNR